MRQAMLKLEVFETAEIDNSDAVFDSHQAEKLRETAYEQGYAAGWQDALEHMRNEDALRRIASEEALQAISFSYHEAHGALQPAFLALARAMLEVVLPEAVRRVLPVCLDAELRAIVAKNIQPSILIRCAPSACISLEPIVAAVPSVQIKLVAEPSFTEAQIALSLGAQERIIDLDNVLDGLHRIFAQSAHRLNDKETLHG